jgi:hypothetical protein
MDESMKSKHPSKATYHGYSGTVFGGSVSQNEHQHPSEQHHSHGGHATVVHSHSSGGVSKPVVHSHKSSEGPHHVHDDHHHHSHSQGPK